MEINWSELVNYILGALAAAGFASHADAQISEARKKSIKNPALQLLFGVLDLIGGNYRESQNKETKDA